MTIRADRSDAPWPVPAAMALVHTGKWAHRSAGPGRGWREQILALDWDCAEPIPLNVQPDDGAGLTQGIIDPVNKDRPRKPGDWGALRVRARDDGEIPPMESPRIADDVAFRQHDGGNTAAPTCPFSRFSLNTISKCDKTESNRLFTIDNPRAPAPPAV